MLQMYTSDLMCPKCDEYIWVESYRKCLQCRGNTWIGYLSNSSVSDLVQHISFCVNCSAAVAYVPYCLMELLLKRQSRGKPEVMLPTEKASMSILFHLLSRKCCSVVINCHFGSMHANLFSSGHCLQLMEAFWSGLSSAVFKNSMYLFSADVLPLTPERRLICCGIPWNVSIN